MSVYLRALEPEDHLSLYEWRNDFNITDLLGGNRFYVSKQREKEWVEAAIKEDKNNLRLAICLTENHCLIGLVNLTNIDHVNKKAEFSIIIGDKNQQGKGYGLFATQLMLKHAYEELNLHKVWLSVLQTNKNAQHIYQKIGFITDGILRQDVFKNNKYQNLIIMSMLKDEYESRNN